MPMLWDVLSKGRFSHKGRIFATRDKILRSSSSYQQRKTNISLLTLSPLDGPYGPQTNTVKDYLPGGRAQNIVIVLMAFLMIVHAFI